LDGCVDIEGLLSKETRHIDPHHPSMLWTEKGASCSPTHQETPAADLIASTPDRRQSTCYKFMLSILD
jgi:hypothetical protein